MEVKDLDAWVEQLNNCQQLSEQQVKNLTDKVLFLCACLPQNVCLYNSWECQA